MEVFRDKKKKGVKANPTCVQKATNVSLGKAKLPAWDKQRAALCDMDSHMETFSGHAKISG